MGNLCSKSANKDTDNFSTPGRVLGTADTTSTNNKASVPTTATKKLTESTPGRTLGSRDGVTSGGGAGGDARSAAAKAAEERANASTKKPTGKLGDALAAQKRQTQNQTLSAGAESNLQARNADENAEVRNWN